MSDTAPPSHQTLTLGDLQSLLWTSLKAHGGMLELTPKQMQTWGTPHPGGTIELRVCRETGNKIMLLVYAQADGDGCLSATMHSDQQHQRPPAHQDPLMPIAPDARHGKLPCGECHLKPNETCDICGAERASSWQPEETAPGGKWLRTRLEGESGENVCKLFIWDDGDRQWIEEGPDGRTTLTHAGFAAPSHWQERS